MAEQELPPMKIISGMHTGEPIGHLTGSRGEIISVWSTKPADLIEAMMQAIGPVPLPPTLGVGGHVEVVRPTNPKHPPQAIYNPAGDVVNQELTDAFQTQVDAWNQRAQLIQATTMKILESQLKTMEAQASQPKESKDQPKP